MLDELLEDDGGCGCGGGDIVVCDDHKKKNRFTKLGCFVL
jgi:hypothetical protein